MRACVRACVCVCVSVFVFNVPQTAVVKMETGPQFKVGKGAKIRNRYNQVSHLTQDTNGKVTNTQLDTTNESQEVSPFPAGDHKAYITDAHKDLANTRQNKNIKDPQKKNISHQTN